MKKLFVIIVSVITAAIMLTSCASEAPRSDKQLFALDTVISLTAYGDGADDALNWAAKSLTDFENTFSATRPESEVYKINSTNDFVQVDNDTISMLNTAQSVSKATDGAFDITIYPVVELWGFPTQEYKVPAEADITEALKLVDYSKIETDGSSVRLAEGRQLDLGGIAKGFISQKLADGMKERGIQSALFSLGGNVQTVGNKPDGSKWTIGLQDPADDEAIAGTLDVGETAVITSGPYQRYFEQDGVRYHHIIDPKTGAPAQSGLTSVTIVCDDGTYADGLSTALFIMGLEKGLEFWRENGGFEAIFIDEEGGITATRGLEGTFKLSSGSQYSLRFTD